MSADLDDYKRRIGIPEGHSLSIVKGKWEVRKGQDIDTDVYEQLDEQGVIVARYEIVDATSTHPPFHRSVTYRRIG